MEGEVGEGGVAGVCDGVGVGDWLVGFDGCGVCGFGDLYVWICHRYNA